MRTRWLSGRVIAKAGIFLLLGAIVNVAVAWGCALTVEYVGWPQSRLATDEETQFWRSIVAAQPRDDDWPADFLPSNDQIFTWLPSSGTGADGVWLHDADRLHHLLRVRAGLPLRSLGYWDWVNWKRMHPSTASSGLWTIVAEGKKYELPFHPIWPGFVANSILYASVFWLILAGCRSYRSWRRFNDAQCALCGYPIGTSPVCTECGVPLPKRAGR